MGRRGGLSGFSSEEIETLQKLYSRHSSIHRKMVEEAFLKAKRPTVPYVVFELKLILKEATHVS
jgi:hypothetical protein